MRLPRRWWVGAPAPRRSLIALGITTGATAALVSSKITGAFVLPAFWLVVVLGVGLAVVDIRRHRLPHVLTGTLWASSGCCFIAETIRSGDHESIGRATIAGATVAVLLLIIAIALPGQLGLGDVSFSGVLAFTLGWLGWQHVLAGLLTGLTLQALIAAVLVTRCGEGAHIMPMGPALFLGWLFAVVV